jgi:hypothetical protein
MALEYTGCMIFQGTNCNIDHYLVIAKVGENWQTCKQAAQKSDVEGVNLRKLSELEVKKHYQINISNKSAPLENLNDSKDISRAW